MDGYPHGEFVPASEYNVEEDEKIVGQIYDAIGNTAELEALKEKLARRLQVIEAYENGTVPTFDSYAAVFDKLLERTAHLSGDETVEAVRKLAEGRLLQVRGAIRRYIENVTKFQHQKRKIALGGRAEREDYIAVDKQRKQTHDALIETLRTTSRTIGELQAIVQEEGGEPLKLRGYPTGSGNQNGELVFDSSFFDNRDAVRDWAIAAWTIQQIHKAKQKTV